MVAQPALTAALSRAEERWELYPIHPVDDQGVCTCSKGRGCESPGKHPMTPNGIHDASSDPERIKEMFARRPGANVGLRTGRSSKTAVLDTDPRHGGWQSLERLQAEHGPLPSTRLHATGGGGYHHVFAFPEGVEWVPSRTLARGVELKADGVGVVLPPSKHESGGEYRVLVDAPLTPLPTWVLERVLKPELTVHEGSRESRATQPTESRFELPECIYEGTRNRTLYRYGCSLRAHGWNHRSILDGLRHANEERCVPALDDAEVSKVAQSAASHAPGRASMVAPEVLEALALLHEAAQRRPKSGIGAHSRWAVYRALLDCAREHGWMHQGRGVAVRISVRLLALDSGVSKPTVRSALEALDAALLVYRASHGDGMHPGVLVLRVPRRAHPLPSRTTPVAPPTGKAVYPSPPLYRTRHGYSMNKLGAAVLEQIIEWPGSRREELAESLEPERKPESLKRPLKQLREAGLVENGGVRGRYWPVEGWQHVLDRVRTMSGEKLAENLAQQRDEREREAYRRHLAELPPPTAQAPACW
jgi:DNA-binding transcriptional ArsR family regulator